jgi:hypothetical protein
MLQEQQQSIGMRRNVQTRSDSEYTDFTLARILRHWREQRPSNEGDHDWMLQGSVGQGRPASDLIVAS